MSPALGEPGHSRSERLFAQARRLMPGGVSSPVRAFRSVGGVPRFIQRAAGAHLIDADGNPYIDYVLAWGSLVLGHAHPRIVQAIQETAARGTSYGAPTELENELAQRIVDALPSVEMVRFVNSGTEAVMSALRLARAYTGRRYVLKFIGCYHGHSDGLLVQAGSGVAVDASRAAQAVKPSSPGVTEQVAAETLLAPYNDLASVHRVFSEYGDQIAAVVVEPVAGNMGLVPPIEGFLAGLREITQRFGTLLVFDEVITGFRVGWQGAQGKYGVTPDLTCLGKIIGGGLPVGAYGGAERLMRLMSPEGPVYQAGTLSGNPLCMAAGVATLDVLREGLASGGAEGGVYAEIEARAVRLATGLREAARSAGVTASVTQVGGMVGLFFLPHPPRDFSEAQVADTRLYARFFHGMLQRGVYFPPALFESLFVSTAHTEAIIDATVAAAQETFQEISMHV